MKLSVGMRVGNKFNDVNNPYHTGIIIREKKEVKKRKIGVNIGGLPLLIEHRKEYWVVKHDCGKISFFDKTNKYHDGSQQLYEIKSGDKSITCGTLDIKKTEREQKVIEIMETKQNKYVKIAEARIKHYTQYETLV